MSDASWYFGEPDGNLVPGKYTAITVDPPWDFKTFSKGGQARSPSRHFKIMSFVEMVRMPVEQLAMPDAWLFLWVPGPNLMMAGALMSAWGFEYSGTGFVWAKTEANGIGWVVDANAFVMGLGYTTRKNVELCLLGRRGKPKRKSKAVRELIVAPRREHSRKPDEVYPRVEALCGGACAELFARQRWPGWDQWGLERDLFKVDPTAVEMLRAEYELEARDGFDSVTKS